MDDYSGYTSAIVRFFQLQSHFHYSPSKRNMYRVDRNKKLNLAEKGAIIALTQSDKSIGQIANSLGISKSSVSRWQQRFEETGDIKRKDGSGRPRLTTREQDRLIIQEVQRQPITTAAAIQGQLFYHYDAVSMCGMIIYVNCSQTHS